ncbi:hypothetical protein COLO4_07509 [Corchorus olitorius]|uniref:Uncharacterized protein n=1 Tax=Corchorus olitorius TaxID=93759 RepID=A0A1R3KJH7_9ROSI|nr:hypothetical protein COLO4_07509 [Corchorus olitorius]
MESTSPETKASSQPNQGPSLSAFYDAIALQEQCFEQRLLSQQLWSQQFADAQEARIKAVARQTTAYAAEVNHILRGEKSVAPEVGTEIFSSEGGNKEEPQLQLPQASSISIPRSTSLLHNPEVHVEHRMYSPGDDVSKRGLPNFNCHTNDDDYKDRHRLSNRERRDGRLRRSPSVERSWNRRRRSPSKSEHRNREDYHSSRVGSFRGHSGDDKGRNHYRRRRSPVDDRIPHHGRSSDSRKHREHRGMKGASSLVTGRKNESRDHLSEDRYKHHGDYDNDKINEHGLPKGTNSCTKYMKTREQPLSKDMIVKNEQLDKTSLINKEFDHRDAKELPKLRSKDESEPLGRKQPKGTKKQKLKSIVTVWMKSWEPKRKQEQNEDGSLQTFLSS